MLHLSFIWHIFELSPGHKGNINKYSAHVLRWQILKIIRKDSRYNFLKKSSELEDFNFAEKMARTYLNYMERYPADEKWKTSAKAESPYSWQGELWKDLSVMLRDKTPLELLNELDFSQFKKSVNKDIVFFGVEQFNTLQFQAVLKLAEYFDIHIMLGNPCPQEYWYDIKPESQIHRKVLADPDYAYLMDAGNPILANLGFSKMSLLDKLFTENCQHIELEQSHSSPVSMLQSIKHDIFSLYQKPQKFQADNSIKINSCHSRLREVEVSLDEILASLDENPNLKPEDIIIVAPEINDYTAYIHEVLDSGIGRKNQKIPYHIYHKNLADNEYFNALLKILNSFNNQMQATEIYEVLSLSPIADKYCINNDELIRIKKWILDSNIRSFYSAEHKKSMNFAADITNSWKFGVNRWLDGYISGNTADTKYLSVYGDLQGQESLFNSCFNFLNDWYQFYKKCTQSHTPNRWFEIIMNLCKAFLLNESDKDYQQKVFDLLTEKLVTHPLDCEIELPLNVIINIVEETLNEQSFINEGRIGVRFQSWENSFIVDAKLLIIIGLNEKEFPRNEVKNDLDIYRNRMPELNTSIRARDKNLMLTALTENTEKLVISYIGFDSTNNEEVSPSVVVSEFIQYLKQKTNDEFEIRKHKLHGFDKSYFTTGSQCYLHRNYLLANDYYKQQPFHVNKKYDSLIETESEYEVSVNELCEFFADPQNHFLRNRAEINHNIYADILKDTETYYPDPLERWQLKNEIISYGKNMAAKTGILAGVGSAYSQLSYYTNELQRLIHAREESKLQLISHSLQIIEFKIFGNLTVGKNGNLLEFHTGNLKGQSSKLCKFWIKHLFYGSERTSRIYFEDKYIDIRPFKNRDELLLKLLQQWQLSQSRPWLYCATKRVNVNDSGLSKTSDTAYINGFESGKFTHVSEGQSYFYPLIKEYLISETEDAFIETLIESAEIGNDW